MTALKDIKGYRTIAATKKRSKKVSATVVIARTLTGDHYAVGDRHVGGNRVLYGRNGHLWLHDLSESEQLNLETLDGAWL